jgi:hypothetical protein
MSPHLHGELAHRRAALADALGGGSATRARPFAERSDDGGGWGSHCATGGDHFGDWTCAEGLTCAPVLGEAQLGMCQHAEPRIGAACETGSVTQEADPHRDRVGAIDKRSCGAGVCERNAVGFPGGMCAGRCGNGDEDAVCGAIAILTDFNDCLAQRKPFAACIRDNARPAALRRCDALHPCRDDYICARAEGSGACIPPYFLFQLRVDGHP